MSASSKSDPQMHHGPVDIRFGHVSTDRSLIVGGDVRRAAGVRAGGDLEIRGAIEGGSVYAGGSIHVLGPIIGGDAGIVVALGDLTATRAERIPLRCSGTLRLNDSTHSILEAGTIEIAHSIRGGRASAQHSVTVQDAGSPNGNETILAAGLALDPLELPDEPIIVRVIHEVVSVPLREFESERPVSISSLTMRASRPASVYPPTTHPPAVHATTRPPTLRARASTGPIATAIPSHRPLPYIGGAADVASVDPGTRAAHRARAEELLRQAVIEVRGVAHEGVIIQLGELRLLIDRDLHAMRFSYDAATQKILSAPLTS